MPRGKAGASTKGDSGACRAHRELGTLHLLINPTTNPSAGGYLQKR